MLVNEISGKTTLMASAETPRALVLAWVTGVGALAAAAGAARPRATALPRTTTAPTVLGSRRPTPDLSQLRIPNPPGAVCSGSRAARGYPRRSGEERQAPAVIRTATRGAAKWHTGSRCTAPRARARGSGRRPVH